MVHWDSLDRRMRMMMVPMVMVILEIKIMMMTMVVGIMMLIVMIVLALFDFFDNLLLLGCRVHWFGLAEDRSARPGRSPSEINRCCTGCELESRPLSWGTTHRRGTRLFRVGRK